MVKEYGHLLRHDEKYAAKAARVDGSGAVDLVLQLEVLRVGRSPMCCNRGTDLVVEIHLVPNGKVEAVRPTIGLYFTEDPPGRTPEMLRLGIQSIDIPAGEKAYTISDSFVLPVDVEVHAIQPHAHYRAREINGVATLPDGSTKPLIYIKDWDFHWQHVYRYVTPLLLPKGSTLSKRSW